MSAWEIILIVGCVLFVTGVIAAKVVAKKKGKPSCGCGCSDCSACQHCKMMNENRDPNGQKVNTKLSKEDILRIVQKAEETGK